MKTRNKTRAALEQQLAMAMNAVRTAEQAFLDAKAIMLTKIAVAEALQKAIGSLPQRKVARRDKKTIASPATASTGEK